MKIFKDRFEPCCGFSLKWAVRLMSVMNVLMVSVGVGLLFLDIFQLWNKWQREKIENTVHYYTRLIIWIAYGVHVTTSIPIDYLLFKCSKTENILFLRISCVATLINNTFALTVYYYHTFFFGLHIQTLAIYNGYLFCKYYECAVINYFVKEIQEEREFASAKRNLTDAELQEFQEGIFPLPLDFETKALLEKVNYQRFKKEEFEIPQNQLHFDMSTVVGQGAFGCVYKAQLIKSDGYETTVAVKMINPDETDVVYFKALLTELKIMSCIGKHANIIQFVGATTKNIKERKLLMIMEFCAFGNMTDYLRGSRGLFRNLVRNGEICNQKSHYDTSPFSDNELVSTEDLVRWAYEMACGMQFLESKKVIHGDLATRNVLLNSKRVAKITDFGLARQLYAYAVYVRKQNTPLPWRYLSPEALTDMTFSSASDVWSYAITLCEIFTLCEMPWPGYDFSLMFVEELKHGMKPGHPAYAPDFIYNNVILPCLSVLPSERPTFPDILVKLREKYTNLLVPSKS